jgi:hypothetical protein
MYRRVIVLCVAFAAACDGGARPLLESHESERYGFTRFMESIAKFPYSAEERKVSRVKEGFRRLVVGMDKDAVGRLMGEPDAEMLHYKPTSKGKELVYSTWTYYLKRFEREQFKEDFDQMVALYFKPDGVLYWADPGHTDGLMAVGAPTLYPESMISGTK